MMTLRKLEIIVFLIIALWFLTSCAPSYANPPQNLRGEDLEGAWVTNYGKNIVDRIIIREDGKFKQTYQDEQANYKFETDWNSWWLEYLPDGSVYIHLDGGRYYPAGTRIAELEGMQDPCPNQIPPDCNQFRRAFWDPYSGKAVKMPGELILTVRVDSSGELIFHQMMQSPDEGFAIIGGDQAIFHRINANGSES